MKNIDFVEAYNTNGTVFYGDASTFNELKKHLERYRLKGELNAVNHCVLIYGYIRDEKHRPVLTRIKKSYYKNGWILENKE